MERGTTSKEVSHKKLIDIDRMAWLHDRRKQIEDADAERFGVYPKGPILPDACVSARRLPSNWGDKKKHVYGLTVSPVGEACLTTRRDNKHLVVVGEHEYVLPWEAKEGEHSGRIFVLGTDAETNEPITHLQIRKSNQSRYARNMKARVPHRGIIYRGRTEVLHNQRLDAPLLLRDGRVAYLRYNGWNGNDNGGGSSVLIDGKVVHTQETDLTHLFESSDGTLYAGRDVHQGQEYGKLGETPIDDKFFGHFAETRRGMRIIYPATIMPVPDEHPKLLWGVQGVGPRETMQGIRPYLHGYTELPDGREAYVGDARMDRFQCLVVGDAPQIGLELVSPPFERNGQWYYYGIANRILCTFEIPLAPKR